MRVTVFGAGAIGGHLAARLCQVDGVEVSVVARGAHLAAIQAQGLRLFSPTGDVSARPAAFPRAQELPRQDVVFVTLKAPALPGGAEAIAGLLGPESCAVFFVNGVPWWMSDPRRRSALDPDGRLRAAIGLERTLGGIVYSANAVEAPGVVRHLGYDDWIVGEPDGQARPRLERIRDLLVAAGLNGRAAGDLHREIWLKLVRNASASPLSALTRLGPHELCVDPDLAPLVLAIRREIGAIAAAEGAPLCGEPTLASLADMNRPEPIRPSMLQDVLSGRPMEVDAILGEPVAMGRAHGVPTPAMESLLPLLRGLDRSVRERG